MNGLRSVSAAYRYPLYYFAAICGILNSIAVTIAFRFVSHIHGGIISPSHTAQEATDIIMAQREGILAAVVILGVSAPLFYWFAVVTSLQMRRIEGGWGLLSMTQLVTAVVATPGYLYPLAVLATAAYRADRDPDIILMLSDQFWLTFVGVAAILCVNIFAIGISALVDRRPKPVFPKWSGFVFIILGIVFFPGVFVYVFQDGPFAWDGFFTSKLPGWAFLIFVILLTVLLIRAIRQEQREERADVAAAKEAAAAAAAHDSHAEARERRIRRAKLFDLWEQMALQAEAEADLDRR